MRSQPLVKTSLVERRQKTVFTWESGEKEREGAEEKGGEGARERSFTVVQPPSQAKKEKATKARFIIVVIRFCLGLIYFSSLIYFFNSLFVKGLE